MRELTDAELLAQHAACKAACAAPQAEFDAHVPEAIAARKALAAAVKADKEKQAAHEVKLKALQIANEEARKPREEVMRRLAEEQTAEAPDRARVKALEDALDGGS